MLEKLNAENQKLKVGVMKKSELSKQRVLKEQFYPKAFGYGKEEIMFGIGMPELIIILVIALIIFGPKKLPELGKSLGRAIKEFRKTSQELKEEIELDDIGEPLKIDEEDELKEKKKDLL